MTTIVTRAGKGTPLTNNEVDANFTNLNTDKLETSAIGTLVPSMTGYNNVNWDTAYGWGNHASAGYLTSSTAASSYQPLDGDLTSIAGLAGTSGFLKKTAANTWSLDTNTYLTGNQSISVSGDATGSGTTSIALTLASSGVTAGTYNNVATEVRPFTVDAKGRVTSIGAAVTIAPAFSSITSKPTTLAGYGITDAQALDADLTAIAALAGTSGFLKKTADNTWTLDTSTYLTGNQSISVSGDATGSGTTSIALTLANSGVTAGTYNNVATEVRPFTVDAKGRVTSIGTAVTIAPAFSSVTGKPTTLAGYGITDAQALDADLTAIAALAGTSGLLKKTAANTWTLDTATYLTGNQSISVSGDATGSGTTSIALTLANSGVTAGTYTKLTVDAKGRATAGASLAASDIPDLTLEKVPDAWVKRSVKAATTANITLSGTQTIDGIALVAGDRVLVKDQTTASQNGIYMVSATAWSRSADADTISELAGACVSVDSGTVNGGWRFDTDLKTTDTLNTTAVTFYRVLDTNDIATANTANKVVQRDASGNFSAGTITAALSGNATTATTLQTGRTIGMTGDVTWTSASFNGSGNVTGTATLANSGVTAGTYNNSATQVTPLTVDAKGRVTAAGTAVTITPAFSSVTGKPTTLSGYGITDAAPLASPTFTGSVTLPGTGIWNSSGNVGIGTLVPDRKLHVEGGKAVIRPASEQYALNLAYNNATAGVWLGSPSANTFAIYDDAGAGLFSVTSAGAVSAQSFTGGLAAGTGASGTWGISVSGSAATLTTARTINGTSFDGSANITTANWGTARTLTIGATGKSVSGAADVSWTVAEIIPTTTNLQINSLGVGTPASATAGEIRATNNVTAYYSDDRLKTRLGLIADALDKLCGLEGFYYEANETAQALGYDRVREVGVSAQQVQKILPEIVVPAPIDDKYLTVRYEKLIPLIIEAVKELRAEVRMLRR